MRLVAFFLLTAALAAAADDKVARGAEVYRASCAVAYCHGPEGKPGRAPALGGRSFQPETVGRIVAMGIPNTSMPSFAALLKPEDIQAVVAYVVSLNGSGPVGSKPPSSSLPADASRGRDLFFDAARTGACGSCHELGGKGKLVSIALQDLAAAHWNDLRQVPSPGVLTAQPAGEPPFPAVVAEKTAKLVRVYDLSSLLPVLRTFAPDEVTLSPGSSWSHAAPAALYTDAELTAIGKYLSWKK